MKIGQICDQYLEVHNMFSGKKSTLTIYHNSRNLQSKRDGAEGQVDN